MKSNDAQAYFPSLIVPRITTENDPGYEKSALSTL